MIDQVVINLESDTEFDQKRFNKRAAAFEEGWTRQSKPYSATPEGNPVTQAKRISQKYFEERKL